MASIVVLVFSIALALALALAPRVPLAPAVDANALRRVPTPLARALGGMLLWCWWWLCAGWRGTTLRVQGVQGDLWVGRRAGRAVGGGWLVVGGGVDSRGGGCGARAGAGVAGGNIQGAMWIGRDAGCGG